MTWEIPNTVGGIVDWIVDLPSGELDRFIEDAEYLLEPSDGSAEGTRADQVEQELTLATILGAARLWRDSGTHPLQTIRAIAPQEFFA